MQLGRTTDCDALVIGSGIAGLSFALHLAEDFPTKNIIVLTKNNDNEQSSSAWAQGGIAAAVSLQDSAELHAQDTLKAGAGLCHEDVVSLCTTEGPARIRDLLRWGIRFTESAHPTLDATTAFDLAQEGGHSQRRILHVADHTGKSVMASLLAEVEKHPNITVMMNHIVIDLVSNKKFSVSRNQEIPACVGAYVLDINSQEVNTIETNVTLLATGGAGKVYKYTSNPDANNGDGIALAARIGARIANMEFIQFHPTCLYHPEAKNLLISEALRGEGAILKNLAGERFMLKYTELAELAPRDIVALSIDKELKKSGDKYVLLDISHLPAEEIKQRFPGNLQALAKYGFDLCKDPIPVVPAAHYTCGGVVSDLQGRSNINGLYVAGEVAHTGLHGANRLASNSLLEALVFSQRAAKHVAQMWKQKKPAVRVRIPPWDHGLAREGEEEVIVSHLWEEIRTFMWNYVGIMRSNQRLDYASRRIALLKQEIIQIYWNRKVTKHLIELRNLITVAELIVTSAKLRRESRGLHQNIDYPHQDDAHYLHDTLI